MIKIKVEMRKEDIFDEYFRMFDDTFPSVQLGLDEDICRECLRKGKDVYELGYLEKDKKIY